MCFVSHLRRHVGHKLENEVRQTIAHIIEGDVIIMSTKLLKLIIVADNSGGGSVVMFEFRLN